MIGLILLYFIGKAFYNLAHEYDKQRWLYAIVSIVFYYVVSILSGILLVIILELLGVAFFDETDDLLLGLISMPFGLAGLWGFHTILKRKWSKEDIFSEDMIDEIGRD